MSSSPQLQVLAWLIFVWGIALMVIASRRGKEQVRSATLRISGVLAGLAFCLLAAIPIWADSSVVRKALVIAAAVAILASWYLGRHSRKMDRAIKHAG
ncbi:MAG: hypothetical protein ABIZ70_15840 [Gemmatimonadales bacterium]